MRPLFLPWDQAGQGALTSLFSFTHSPLHLQVLFWPLGRRDKSRDQADQVLGSSRQSRLSGSPADGKEGTLGLGRC